ncbi:hypothetical protein [Actinomadura sp. 9N407]|uniref:hypothetical protein n=1 Tax=Actinomadura sp. 9N407 TaxID=3375154 RepID=UPI0037A5CB32
MRCPACGSDTGTDLTTCARCNAPLAGAAGFSPDPLGFTSEGWHVERRAPGPEDDPHLMETRFADIPPAVPVPYGPPPARRAGLPGYLGWAIAGGFALALAGALIVLWPSGDSGRNAAGAGSSGPPEPAETSSEPVASGEKFYVDTFTAAEGYAQPGTAGGAVGRLAKGTHYVFCKQQGQRMQREGGKAYNHWWLLTNLDEVYAGGAPKAYVPALYLSRWGNDEAKDNSGRDIPDCPR